MFIIVKAYRHVCMRNHLFNWSYFINCFEERWVVFQLLFIHISREYVFLFVDQSDLTPISNVMVKPYRTSWRFLFQTWWMQKISSSFYSDEMNLHYFNCLFSFFSSRSSTFFTSNKWQQLNLHLIIIIKLLLH
jgi:hypothetical protein